MHPPSLEADKQALVARLKDAREALLTLVRNLPIDQVEAPGAMGDWSVKDIIGHIASWEDRLLTMTQMVLNGQADKIDWIDSDEALQAWNHRQQRRKQDWSWSDTIRELALLREEVLWNVDGIEPAQLFQPHDLAAGRVSPAELLEGIAAHDQEHLVELRTWAEGNPEELSVEGS